MEDKEFLLKQKELILEQLKTLESSSNPQYEEIGSTGDDNVAEFEEFEEKVALSNKANKQIVELKAALKKLEEGGYGKCEKCGSAIERGRLKAFPASKFCSTDAK